MVQGRQWAEPPALLPGESSPAVRHGLWITESDFINGFER